MAIWPFGSIQTKTQDVISWIAVFFASVIKILPRRMNHPRAPGRACSPGSMKISHMYVYLLGNACCPQLPARPLSYFIADLIAPYVLN